MADIIIAFGCEIRDGANHSDLVTWLNANASAGASASTWTYPPKSPAHTISLIYTKAEFAAALDKKDAIVIYDGHSRIGQGPAFGPAGLGTCPDKAKFPSNPWGDSFRMGFDLADIECLGDILHHGTNPTEYVLPKDAKSAFASTGLRGILTKALKAAHTCGTAGGWRALATCKPKVAARTNCRGETPLASRHYWRARRGDKDFDTLVAVGDADLAATKLACSVFFVNSCSSKRHFYPALARHKKKVKSACVFFVTADVCSAQTTRPFLEAVLAGKSPQKNAASILKRLNRIRGSGFITLEK